jgi:hypothetical protein
MAMVGKRPHASLGKAALVNGIYLEIEGFVGNQGKH